MVSGDICYFIEDKAYQVVGGSLLLIDINKIHKLVNSSGETFERITLVFKREFLEDLFPNNKTLDLLSTFTRDCHLLRFNGSEQNFIEKLFNKMVSEFTKQPPGYEFYLKTLMFELLIYIYRHQEAMPPAITEEISVVNKKYLKLLTISTVITTNVIPYAILPTDSISVLPTSAKLFVIVQASPLQNI